MATLPGADALGERPIPQASSSVASYEPPNWRQVGVAGQNISQGGNQLGQTADIIAAANSQQDQSVVRAAANTLDTQRLSLEFDPNTGFRQQKGSQVVTPDFQKTWMQKFTDAQTQIAGTLTNPDQKTQFEQHSAIAALAYQGDLYQHQARETLAFNHQVNTDAIANAQTDLAGHPYDEDTAQKSLLTIGAAVVKDGQAMGLDGEALASYFKDNYGAQKSKALFYRTTGMLQANDWQGATDFFHDHELDFDPADRLRLGSQIKTTADAQTSRTLGQQAFQAAAATTLPSTLPADLNAPLVKPYDQARISQIVDQVRQPSPYDDIFKSAAQQYGVSPNELKLRAVAESGMNPNAQSTDATGKVLASGIMQIAPATAAGMGIDPNDPAQAIAAAARLMAGYGGTMGGDMSMVDKRYYGGANQSAWGPNTAQYAENLRAVRQQAFGQPNGTLLPTAALEASEGHVVSNAVSLAQQSRPGDKVYEDQVVAEAYKYWTRGLQTMKDQDYSNFSGVLDASVRTGVTSPNDLPPDQQQAFAKLTPQDRASVYAQFDRNLRAASGEFTRSDPALVNNLTQRIYAADGDPQKITSPGQLSAYMGQGLNYTDQQRLIKQMAEANTPEGNPFLKQVNGVKETARKMLTSSMSAQSIQHPEMAEEAAYRFGVDLDNRIKAARAANVDPQTLLTPGGPTYALDPNRVAAFMPTASQIAAGKAQTPSTAPVVPRQPGETPAQYLSRTGQS